MMDRPTQPGGPATNFDGQQTPRTPVFAGGEGRKRDAFQDAFLARLDLILQTLKGVSR